MMMNSVTPQGMRVLSDAEIALVAGGPGQPEENEAGVDALVDRNSMLYLSQDGAFVQTTVTMAGMSADMIAWDRDGNGAYDMIWARTAGGAWLCSMNGEFFDPCSDPITLINSYNDRFHEPNEVPEG